MPETSVTRVKQAGKGYYMYVTVGQVKFWARISKDVHDKIKPLLKAAPKEKPADAPAK